MKKEKKNFMVAASMLAAFVLWTVAVRFVDVQPIGPQASSVGFATVNGFVHNLTGVHMSFYTVTDWLGLVPFCFVAMFGILGLVQWIKRKRLFKVDADILVLGVFYIVVMAFFVLFEKVVINHRPVLIGGVLEASYPSSTTMLVMCVMPTAIMQLRSRVKNKACKGWITGCLTAFTAFMVIFRLVSGVHWFTDIVGGGLLSAGLVLMYRTAVGMLSAGSSQ